MTDEERIADLEKRLTDVEELLVWTASLSQWYWKFTEPRAIVSDFAEKLRKPRVENTNA